MIPAFLLILAAVSFRIATGMAIISGTTWVSNFAPIAAIALCGAVYFPPKLKFAVPLTALFLSDLVLNIYYNAPILDPLIFCRYFALVLVACLGVAIARQPSWRTLIPASLISSTVFYVVTNVFSWLSDPGYLKNFSGLLQSLTVGLPEYGATPTWMFFRNSVVSDLIFTGLFFLCMKFVRQTEQVRAEAALPGTV